MPFVVASLLNAAFGLLAAWASAPELRASPRSVGRLRGFAALAAHEVLLVAPCALYLLVRHGDWMASYVLDASRVPSAVGVLLSLSEVLVALTTFSLGAHWIRTQRPALCTALAFGLLLTAIVGLVAARERLHWVGTQVQFRAGFGMRSLWHSRLLAAMALMSSVWLAAAAHMIRTLRGGAGAVTLAR